MKKLLKPSIALLIGLVTLAQADSDAINKMRLRYNLNQDLSVYYRADNVDGNGNPGDAATTNLVNLINPGTYNGTVTNGVGVTSNTTESVRSPFLYGIVLSDASQAHIQANTYQIGGGVNKVTAATWEFWLRADKVKYINGGQLYGEFAVGGVGIWRHGLSLKGINTASRYSLYDEYPPSGNGVSSDAQLFETGEFTQIAVTKVGDTLTFYKNGVQSGTTKTNAEAYNGSKPNVTYFGRQEGTVRCAFDGQFNIIRVYDAALSPTQVLQSYEAEYADPWGNGTLIMVN